MYAPALSHRPHSAAPCRDATRRMRHSFPFPFTRVRACAREEEPDGLSRASHLYARRNKEGLRPQPH